MITGFFSHELFLVNVRQSKIMYGKSISLSINAKRSENIHNKNNNVPCIHIIIYEVIVIVMVVAAVQKPLIVYGKLIGLLK